MPPLFGREVEKVLVLHSKALSKMGLNPKNHVYSSNGMAITEIFFYSIRPKWGACLPLFKARLEKYFVLYSKVLSKMGLNLENHVYSSNGMAITEFSSDFENSFLL